MEVGQDPPKAPAKLGEGGQTGKGSLPFSACGREVGANKRNPQTAGKRKRAKGSRQSGLRIVQVNLMLLLSIDILGQFTHGLRGKSC